MMGILSLPSSHPSSEPKPVHIEHLARVTLWVVIVQISYAISTAPIRSSVAAGLLRFTRGQEEYKFILKAVIAASCITAVVTTIGATTQAMPLKGLWTVDSRTGWPSSFLEAEWYTYLIYAVSIVLDATIAVVSYRLLWTTSLEFKKKLSIATLLALGAVASLSTIAALVLSILRQEEIGLGGRVGLNMIMVAELGIGIIAGSAAALKLLFTKSTSEASTTSAIELVAREEQGRGLGVAL
jgi:hypothetical protein